MACLTFVWHFLFIVTRIDTHFFFQARVCSLPLFHPWTKFFSNQRQSFFTSVKGLAKSKSRSTHARTHTPKAAKLSTCSPQQAGVRNYSSVELSFLYRGITSKKKKPRNQKYRPSALEISTINRDNKACARQLRNFDVVELGLAINEPHIFDITHLP